MLYQASLVTKVRHFFYRATISIMLRSNSWDKNLGDIYLDLCFRSKFYVRPALRCLYHILGRIRFQLTLRIPSRPECPRCKYLCHEGDANYETHLKNVYDRTMSSRFRHAGSSSTSLSMKNSRGMSTSSPASSFCSSKQKHSTLAKYGAIYNDDNRSVSPHSSDARSWLLTRSGVTLYVAMPITS
jgi:hypothetical protein